MYKRQLVVAEIDAHRIAEARRALPVLANRRFAPCLLYTSRCV
ncbi:hypothetical protein [Erwinia amylovora]